MEAPAAEVLMRRGYSSSSYSSVSAWVPSPATEIRPSPSRPRSSPVAESGTTEPAVNGPGRRWLLVVGLVSEGGDGVSQLILLRCDSCGGGHDIQQQGGGRSLGVDLALLGKHRDVLGD